MRRQSLVLCCPGWNISLTFWKLYRIDISWGRKLTFYEFLRLHTQAFLAYSSSCEEIENKMQKPLEIGAKIDSLVQVERRRYRSICHQIIGKMLKSHSGLKFLVKTLIFVRIFFQYFQFDISRTIKF